MEKMKKFKNEKLIQSLDSERRKELIKNPCSIKDMSTDAALFYNELALYESVEFMDKHCKAVDVKSVKTNGPKSKLGQSYYNSLRIMSSVVGERYDYVEGFVYNKRKKQIFGHAWNRDKNGNHIDFTLEECSDYEYFGVVINSKKVSEVGVYHDGITYCVIPFLDDTESYIKLSTDKIARKSYIDSINLNSSNWFITSDDGDEICILDISHLSFEYDYPIDTLIYTSDNDYQIELEVDDFLCILNDLNIKYLYYDGDFTEEQGKPQWCEISLDLTDEEINQLKIQLNRTKPLKRLV